MRYSSFLLVSLGAISMVYQDLPEHPEKWRYAFFLGFAVFGIYHFHRYYKWQSGQINFTGVKAHSKVHLWLALLSLPLCLMLGWRWVWSQGFWFLISLPIVLWYTVPLGSLGSLRERWWLKGLIISLMWTFSTTILPRIFLQMPFEPELLEVSLFRFSFFYVIAGITDFKDQRNEHNQEASLVKSLGPIYAKIVYLFIIMLAMGLLLSNRRLDYLWSMNALLSLMILLVLVVITNQRHKAWYYTYLVDGQLCFSGLVYYLLTTE